MTNLNDGIPTFDEYKERKGKETRIKPGEIFFVTVANLEAPYIEDCNGEYSSEISTYRIPQTEDKRDFLICVKYLGNGLFEELVTNEVLQISFDSPSLYFGSNPNENLSKNDHCIERKLSDFPQQVPMYSYLNYEDYIYNREYKTPLSRFEYFQHLQNIISENEQHPICLSNCRVYYSSSSDNAKKHYLKHSKEEITEFLKEIKKISIIASKKVNEEIARSMESLKTIPEEDLNIAYLDNELYDFERKGRTK